jgi:hypothetical protein
MLRKSLGGSSRLKPLKLAFAASYGLMRVFCPVVFSEALLVRAAQL